MCVCGGGGGGGMQLVNSSFVLTAHQHKRVTSGQSGERF